LPSGRGEPLLLQSKSGQPFGRYFPETVDALRALPRDPLVLTASS
jgi:hypothetical protein